MNRRGGEGIFVASNATGFSSEITAATRGFRRKGQVQTVAPWALFGSSLNLHCLLIKFKNSINNGVAV